MNAISTNINDIPGSGEGYASGKWKTYILYTLLILAFMNTGLRPSINSPFSYFRIVSPFFILVICITEFRLFSKVIFYILALLIWGTISYYFFHKTTPYAMYAEFLHILFLAGLFVIVDYCSVSDKNYAENFFRFLDWFTIFTLLLVGTEALFKIHIFSAVQAGRLCSSGFFWNENELGMALGAMVPLYWYHGLSKKSIFDFIKIAVIGNLLYQYDCKLTMIALVIFFIFLFYLSPHKRSIVIFWTTALFVFFVIFAMLIMPNIDFRYTGVTQDYTFHKDIYTPIIHILTLTPFSDAVGSVVVRSNAIIFGTKELLQTGLFGIGPGGTYIMLSLSKYRMAGILSMHNFIFHMVCEFGLFFFVSAIWFYVVRIRKFISENSFISKLQLIYAVIFVVLSSQASAAIFSNYMFWTIVFYVFITPRFYHKENTKQSESDSPVTNGEQNMERSVK